MSQTPAKVVVMDEETHPNVLHMFREGAKEVGSCFAPQCHCLDACEHFERVVDDPFLQVAGG